MIHLHIFVSFKAKYSFVCKTFLSFFSFFTYLFPPTFRMSQLNLVRTLQTAGTSKFVNQPKSATGFFSNLKIKSLELTRKKSENVSCQIGNKSGIIIKTCKKQKSSSLQRAWYVNANVAIRCCSLCSYACIAHSTH